MSSYKTYRFQHQKRRFELRIYSMHVCVKLFMDGALRDISVPNTTSKPILEFQFQDERNQTQKVRVERSHSWFKYNYVVKLNESTIFKTIDNEPVTA